MKLLGIIGLVLLVLYIAALLFLYVQQEKFIFYPTVLPDDYKFEAYSNFEEVVFRKTHQKTWHGLYFKVPEPKGCVIYFHGNTGDLSRWGAHAEDFRNLGYAVIMIDYPGFGKSRGHLSENQINKFGRRVYDWALQKFKAEQIVILGRSLGTGPATTLSTKVASKSLILETPFSSIPDMAAQTYKIFPTDYLSRFRFNTLKKIKKTKAPVFVIHGTKDELIPYEMGKSVADAKGTMITIEGANHNDFSDFPVYKVHLANILK